MMNSLDSAVTRPVWQLMQQALALMERLVPVSVVWEHDLPGFSRLISQVETADTLMRRNITGPGGFDFTKVHFED